MDRDPHGGAVRHSSDDDERLSAVGQDVQRVGGASARVIDSGVAEALDAWAKARIETEWAQKQ